MQSEEKEFSDFKAWLLWDLMHVECKTLQGIFNIAVTNLYKTQNFVLKEFRGWYVHVNQQRKAYEWPVIAPPLFFLLQLNKSPVVFCGCPQYSQSNYAYIWYPASLPIVKLPFITFAFRFFLKWCNITYFSITSLKAKTTWQKHILLFFFFSKVLSYLWCHEISQSEII